MSKQRIRIAAPGKTYAVVVGVEKYGYDLLDLPGPARDARDFSDWLTKEKGVPPGNIKLFLSPLPGNEKLKTSAQPISTPATRENIKNCFFKWLDQKPGDLFLFYWSGHGLLATGSGIRRRLCFEDSDEKVLSYFDLKSLIDSMRSNSFKELKRQIYIVDACANIFTQNKLKGKLDELNIETGDDVYPDCKQFQIYSAREGERAKNYPGESIGLFSKVLMKELREASNYNGLIDKLWPPDMDKVFSSLVKAFEKMKKEGFADQVPGVAKSGIWDEELYRILSFGYEIEKTLESIGIPLAELVELVEEIADNLEQSIILEAYRESIPSFFGFAKPVPDASEPMLLFLKCILDLADTPRGREKILYPTHKFLKHLANKADIETRDQINDFLSNAVKMMCMGDLEKVEEILAHLDSIYKLELKKESDTPRKGYILIRMEPMDGKRSTYKINAWLHENNEIKQLLVENDESPIIKKKDMDDYIFRLINGAARKGFSERYLCLEFFLPRKRITEDVDQWLVKHKMTGPEKIGLRCEVVVRSSDRAEDEDSLFLKLKGRWNAIKENDRCLTLPNVFEIEDENQQGCWIEADNCDFEKLKVVLRDLHKMVCVLMVREPGICKNKKDDLLSVLLNAGIPFVMWPRKIPIEKKEDVKTGLTEIIKNGEILKLPERVLGTRKDAIKNPQQYWFGSNITLLRDDPHRLPPKDEGYKYGMGIPE